MGLYADSPSILSVVTSSPTDKSRIESQLKSISRSMQTHPPPWGANIAATILGTQVAYDNWCV
jgi:aspartate aminotransferase